MGSEEQLSNKLPLPQSTINFYEELVNQYPVREWSEKYVRFHIIQYVLLLLNVALFVPFLLSITGIGLSYFGYDVSYIGYFADDSVVYFYTFIGLVYLFGFPNIYYKYIQVMNPNKRMYNEIPPKNLLISIWLYQRTKEYYNDKKIHNLMYKETPFIPLPMYGDSVIHNFIVSDPYNRKKEFEDNIGDLLHNEAVYHQRLINNTNSDFINPQIIDGVQDNNVKQMCYEMNTAYINNSKKTALILSRHIIEAYLDRIFKDDKKFNKYDTLTTFMNEEEIRKRINGNWDGESKEDDEDGEDKKSGDYKPSLAGLIWILEERISIEYKNGINNIVEQDQITGQIKFVKNKSNAAIHGNAKYKSIISDEERLKNDVENILNVLIDIEEHVNMVENGNDEEAFGEFVDN